MVATLGFEPRTQGSSGLCSTELSYIAILLMWRGRLDLHQHKWFCRPPRTFSATASLVDEARFELALDAF